MSQNTEALQGAQMETNDLRRQIQTLEIELASQQSLVMLLAVKAAVCEISVFLDSFPVIIISYKDII